VKTGKAVALAIGWLLAAVLVSATTAVVVLQLDDEAEPAAATTTVEAAQPTGARASGMSVGEVYDAAKDSVVVVDAATDGGPSFPFGDSEGQQAQGSGFVFDDEGRVVTNYHVVRDADSVQVSYPGGRTVDADVVGVDPSTDVAVLDPEEDVDVPALTLADSDEVEVGDPVVAIGSPFGLAGTVTAGIVSALDRTISAPVQGFGIDGVIQTDAAINSGNSGGPLLDEQARVIGINTQIQSTSGGNVGIGYAVPSNTVRDVADELIQDGEVDHAFLGVTMSETDDGVRVEDVREGSPAEEAGLEVGDVITSAGGEAVETPEDLRTIVDDHDPGDELELEVTRDGGEQTVTATLGERPTATS
jgi:putative serine protease PepD